MRKFQSTLIGWTCMLMVACPPCQGGLGGLICVVKNMLTPKWYTPDTEDNAIEIDVDILSKNVTNGDTDESTKNAVVHILHYGVFNPPSDAAVSSSQIDDYAGNSHTISVGFNGTHVCLAINHAQLHDGGSRTEKCIHECGEAFHANASFQPIEYFASEDTTDLKTYNYIAVELRRHPGYQRSRTCYVTGEVASPGKPSYCKIPQQCVTTVTTTNITSDSPEYAFQSSCQPASINCSSIEHCEDNVQAPYVGAGTFDRVCNYCCQFDRCNDIRRCSTDDGNCTFYGPPRDPPTTQPPDNDGTSTSTIISPIFLLNLLPLSIVHAIKYRQ